MDCKFFCVPCLRFLCFECIFTHINGASDAPIHALAKLEDFNQFMSAAGSHLSLAESKLRTGFIAAGESEDRRLAALSETFTRFLETRRRHSEAMVLHFRNVLQTEWRSELRFTREAATWLMLWKRTGALVRLGATKPLVVTELSDPECYEVCPNHPHLRQTVFCVQCNQIQCPKCFARHANDNEGHKCADMEDADQFIQVVQPYVNWAELDMVHNDEGKGVEELTYGILINTLIPNLCTVREVWLEDAKVRFEAEKGLLRRELATTPVEMAYWLLIGEA
jgi:hypothetical protein